MPLPEPNKGEKKTAFISRCMADGEAKKTFPDQKQRAAVCYKQWRDKRPGNDAGFLVINKKGDDTAEVLLYGQIGGSFWSEGISAKDFRDEIKAVDAKILNVRINSPGGSVFEAAAMMAALDEFDGAVEIDVDGVAASAASVVAMGGDTIRMASNAIMMIHDPFSGCMGGADDMRREADLLDKVKTQIIDAYKRKSHKTRDEIDKLMKAETWMTGQEAVDNGFAHSVTQPVQVAAMMDFREAFAHYGFRHVPDNINTDKLRAEAEEQTRLRREIAASLMGG